MATIYTGYYNNARFYVDWSQGEQDIVNNRTLVNWTAGIQAYPGRDSYWYTNAIRINSLYVDNSGNLANGTWSNVLLYNGQTTPLRSGSYWVYHSTDGTKNFHISFSGWLTGNGDMTTSGNFDLTTIPRNSQISTNKSAYTLGEAITIYTNRVSTSFTHHVIIRQNNSSGQVIHTISSVGASATWTPSAAQITTMQQMIPNSKTLTLHISQSSTQTQGESSTTKVLTLTNANPQFSDFTFKDVSLGVVAITGNNQILVKGKSILETKISFDNRMVAIKDSTPSNYLVSFDGASKQEAYNPSTDITSTFSVNSIGQRTILITANDSRANNTSVSKTTTVYDYQDPTIETTLVREDSFGTDTTIDLKGDWSPLPINGVDKNEITIGSLQYRYKEDGGSFSSWVTRAFTITGTRWAMDSTFILSLDNTKKYIFEFEIADKFGTIAKTATVSVGIPVMFVGEVNGLPVLEVGGQPVMQSHVGMIVLSTTLDTDTQVSALYGGTWAVWGTGRVPVGFDLGQTEFNTIEETGGHKLLQSHTHPVDPPNTVTDTQGNHNHGYYRWSALIQNAVASSDAARYIVQGENYVASGDAGNHAHNLNIGSFTSGSSGSGTGQNLQPYITCYMWKRTV